MSKFQVFAIILIVRLKIFPAYCVGISVPNFTCWANKSFLKCGHKIELKNIFTLCVIWYFNFCKITSFSSLGTTIPYEFVPYKQFSMMFLYPRPCSESSFFCDTLWRYPSIVTSAYQTSLLQLIYNLFRNWLPQQNLYNFSCPRTNCWQCHFNLIR